MAVTLNMIGLEIPFVVGTLGFVQQTRNAFQRQLLTDLEDTFFNTSEFASTCIYRHYQVDRSVYSAASYPYIFDNPTIDAGFAASVELTALFPQIQIPKHYMQHYPTTRDLVTVDGILYQVAQYVDDGVGVLTLYLQRSGSKYD